jgi:hypothetical protein
LDEIPLKAELRISADTNFTLFLNGELIGTGQFSDFPDEKTYTSFNLAAKLAAGKNSLSVLIHYCVVDTFSYIPWRPGLWFHLNDASGSIIISDSDTLARHSPGYADGEAPRISPQMGFTFAFDAGKESDWTTAEYEIDDSWHPATVLPEDSIPDERPLPTPEILPSTPSKLVAQGFLLRRAETAKTSVAEKMRTDFLSAAEFAELFAPHPDSAESASVFPLKRISADDFYVIFDLGR